jgi:hypothetical protein
LDEGIVQGCQMFYFQTKNPNVDQFWSVLQWKMLVYFVAVWYILPPFGIFCRFYGQLAHFSPFWYAVPRKNLATLELRRQKKSFGIVFTGKRSWHPRKF